MTRWSVVLTLGLVVVAAPLAAQFRLPVKLEELERRAKADSNDPAAHFNVALAYWNAKRWGAADTALRRAITIDPRFAPAFMALTFLPYAQRAAASGRKSKSGACPTSGSSASTKRIASSVAPT